jgi:ABC-2 type transport system permease protein
MNTAKILNVARWEFVQKAKTKAYIISLVLTPAIIMLFAILPSILASKADTETKRFLLYDETGQFATPLQLILEQRYKLPDGTPNYRLIPLDAQKMTLDEALAQYKPRLLEDEYTGLLIVPRDIFTTRRLEYRGANVGNEIEVRKIGDELEKLVIQHSLVQHGIDPSLYNDASRSLSLTTIKINKSGENTESGFVEVFIAAYGSTLLLFMLVIITGQLLVRSLFEEKSNRIIEILLSSCSPIELMMGKLLGLSGLGILQAVVWLGISLGVGTQFGTIPDIFSLLPFLLVYMLLGYLFYAAILIGFGSLATTEQEAQQITGYMTMLIMLPVALIMPLMQNPNSGLVKTLSYVPFMTPSVMTMRIAVQRPEWWEIFASVGVMIVSIAILLYFSSKIFRAAILSYGKRPTLPEIIGFLREK